MSDEYECVDREHGLWKKRKEPKDPNVNADRLALALSLETIQGLERENAALREALQSIADEAVKHHEHNPISGIDRLPRGYFEILKIATAIDATSKEAQT